MNNIKIDWKHGKQIKNDLGMVVFIEFDKKARRKDTMLSDVKKIRVYGKELQKKVEVEP